jgi:hypothetical protein
LFNGLRCRDFFDSKKNLLLLQSAEWCRSLGMRFHRPSCAFLTRPRSAATENALENTVAVGGMASVAWDAFSPPTLLRLLGAATLGRD